MSTLQPDFCKFESYRSESCLFAVCLGVRARDEGAARAAPPQRVPARRWAPLQHQALLDAAAHVAACGNGRWAHAHPPFRHPQRLGLGRKSRFAAATASDVAALGSFFAKGLLLSGVCCCNTAVIFFVLVQASAAAPRGKREKTENARHHKDKERHRDCSILTPHHYTAVYFPYLSQRCALDALAARPNWAPITLLCARMLYTLQLDAVVLSAQQFWSRRAKLVDAEAGQQATPRASPPGTC